MPKEDWQQNSIERLFKSEGLYPAQRVSTVLDVACGLSFKSQYIEADLRVGFDIYRPFLEKIESQTPFGVVVGDVRNIRNFFLDKSFDLVLLLDIVEHLEKDESLKLIEDAQHIAKTAVIVETPLGFVPQDIDIWGLDGHEFQTHRSEWYPDDFSSLGFSYFTRRYKMSEVKRHTSIEVASSIELIDAIKLL